MTTLVIIEANHGWPVSVVQIDPSTQERQPPFIVPANSTSHFHVHSGADLLIHEIQPEEADTPQVEEPVSNAALPVAGYTAQSDDAVALVNANKRMEELVLRMFDALGDRAETDKRWLAIGRTNIEQGFMAMNRSVFKPERIDLPDDEAKA